MNLLKPGGDLGCEVFRIHDPIGREDLDAAAAIIEILCLQLWRCRFTVRCPPQLGKALRSTIVHLGGERVVSSCPANGSIAMAAASLMAPNGIRRALAAVLLVQYIRKECKTRAALNGPNARERTAEVQPPAW